MVGTNGNGLDSKVDHVSDEHCGGPNAHAQRSWNEEVIIGLSRVNCSGNSNGPTEIKVTNQI